MYSLSLKFEDLLTTYAISNSKQKLMALVNQNPPKKSVKTIHFSYFYELTSIYPISDAIKIENLNLEEDPHPEFTDKITLNFHHPIGYVHFKKNPFVEIPSNVIFYAFNFNSGKDYNYNFIVYSDNFLLIEMFQKHEQEGWSISKIPIYKDTYYDDGIINAKVEQNIRGNV